jgi:hypothetical protein
MFTGAAEDASVIEIPAFTKLMLLLISALMIVAGVMPDFILGLIFR